MAPRYLSPPNWPHPPPGWTPPPGWQPDPSWGPAPPGWQFWVDDGETRDGRRPNRDAWGRAAAVGAGVFVVFGVIAFALAGSNGPEAAGRVFGGVLLAYLVTALIAFFGRTRWGWGRYIAVLLPTYLVFAVLRTVASMS